jgi:hypothetical protein
VTVSGTSPDRKSVLNPYKRSAANLVSRFLWDLRPDSWRSRRRIAALQGSQRQAKAVILCNGPSLLQVDFEKLIAADVYTFGLNKINLLFPKTPFRPSSIVAVNELVLEQNAEFFNTTELPLFLDSSALKRGVNSRENCHFLHATNMRGEFARDCSISIFQGYTVTYVAMQLAFHMGFTKVALVGCDHYFNSSGQANATVKAGESDPDHFDPKYFSGGMKWQLPDIFQSEIAYRLALNHYEAAGRRLVNSTEGGHLELMPRVSLDDFLRD